MKRLFDSLLDWIYKKCCYFCKSSKECVKMCSKCYEEMDFLPVGTNRIIEGKKIFCAGVYSKNLQKLIRGLKYHGQRELAYYCAKFMYEYFSKITTDKDFQIVPVPIFEKRLKQRKYNHMELVANELAAISGMNVNFELIKRVKNTKAQYNLKKSERLVNLKDAFYVDKSKYQGGKILIIDDICTTGSTFYEMIKTLQNSGIEDITCFAATTPFGD